MLIDSGRKEMQNSVNYIIITLLIILVPEVAPVF